MARLDAEQRARLWAVLVIGIPVLLLALFIFFALSGRELFARCPPNCRDADLVLANLAGQDFSGHDLSLARHRRQPHRRRPRGNRPLFRQSGRRTPQPRRPRRQQPAWCAAQSRQPARRQPARSLSPRRPLDRRRPGERRPARGRSRRRDLGRRANLRGVQLDDATVISDRWRTVWAIVNGTADLGALAGANLSKANLADADLPGADLTGANLSGANLAGADLTDAVLDGAGSTSRPWTAAHNGMPSGRWSTLC
ncbi:MAG: pentapeptide repeat-containing protein [Caldilineaceae bacterium]